MSHHTLKYHVWIGFADVTPLDPSCADPLLINQHSSSFILIIKMIFRHLTQMAVDDKHLANPLNFGWSLPSNSHTRLSQEPSVEVGTPFELD